MKQDAVWCFLDKSDGVTTTWFSINTIAHTKEECWEKAYQQLDVQYLRGIVCYRGRPFSSYKDKSFRTMMIRNHGRPARVRLELDGI